MFQRLKGAIDNRIAEEQARQRQATQTTAPRTPARRRPQNPNGTTTRSSASLKETVSTEKGPDPNEFEPDVNEDVEESRRDWKIAEVQGERGEAPDDSTATDKPEVSLDAANNQPQAPVDNSSSPDKASELPTEVRVKLRKLERLESKYRELLSAYRVAHARVQSVESFETTLKEHTPLTSISDPNALAEYLNQVKLKGDLVLDEFKKVSGERDELKRRNEESEQANASLRIEVDGLREKISQIELSDKIQEPDVGATTSTNAEPEQASKSETHLEQAKSPILPASRIPNISLFSPKFGGKKTETADVSGDLFSYDSELPRMEEELQLRNTEIEQLNKKVVSLQGDLKVARESTEGMVQTLETTTRELNTLRDANDKLEAEKSILEERFKEMEQTAKVNADQVDEFRTKMTQLQEQKETINIDSERLNEQVRTLESIKSTLESQLDEQKAQVEFMNEKLSQKDHTVKDLEDSLAMLKKSERENDNKNKSSEKQITIMQGIMDNVRGQLDKAEQTVSELKQELQSNRAKFAGLPSTKFFGFLDDSAIVKSRDIETREDAVNFLKKEFGLESPTTELQESTADLAAPIVAETTSSTPAKKRNKKKKKNTKTVQQSNEGAEPTEDAAEDEQLDSVQDTSKPVPDNAGLPQPAREQLENALQHIKDQMRTLSAKLAEKTAIVDRLTTQLKDQDELKEEIETLRHDLLHQGEEHVEARHELKQVRGERDQLQKSVKELQQQSEDLRQQLTSGADTEKKHKKLAAEHDELQMKLVIMEKDFKAAESLASARFKDISDLKDLLGKAQPELRTLRSEVAELKSTKEDLKNKQGELTRLEAKHEDMTAEMKRLGKRLMDRDSDIKVLQEKIEQETKSRSRTEDELATAQSQLRVAETRRAEIQETSLQTYSDLTKVKEEASSLRAKVKELEGHVSQQTRDISALRDEVQLKVALHTSSQSLVQSLRDQILELNTQAREATSRVDSLEEELTEAQRMLSERTREGSTMRMLLTQAETGTESRIREMKERMDSAIEERDRIEDEANVSSRRMIREVDDAKNKVREAQKQLKSLEDERDDLESKAREWRRRREGLEQAAESANKEVEDVRAAMKSLREALDESEQQIREAEAQKLDLRRQTEESNERVDKLTRANKNLTEEVKMLQQGSMGRKQSAALRPAGGTDSGLQSSRSSIDSSSVATPRSPNPATGSRTALSRTETSSSTGLSQGTVDYVYLKNVLLQFLERKDKNHQRQLIPVLGMLLHFDRNDEQKWISAISAR